MLVRNDHMITATQAKDLVNLHEDQMAREAMKTILDEHKQAARMLPATLDRAFREIKERAKIGCKFIDFRLPPVGIDNRTNEILKETLVAALTHDYLGFTAMSSGPHTLTIRW